LVPETDDTLTKCRVFSDKKTFFGKKVGLIYVFKIQDGLHRRLIYLYVGNVCITEKMSKGDFVRIAEKRLQDYFSYEHISIQTLMPGF